MQLQHPGEVLNHSAPYGMQGGMLSIWAKHFRPIEEGITTPVADPCSESSPCNVLRSNWASSRRLFKGDSGEVFTLLNPVHQGKSSYSRKSPKSSRHSQILVHSLLCRSPAWDLGNCTGCSRDVLAGERNHLLVNHENISLVLAFHLHSAYVQISMIFLKQCT